MTPPPEIFKAYDIRGIHGEQLGPDDAEQIGRAFARVIGELSGKPTDELRLGLGRDMRLSAPEMASRYRDGMTAEGATVIDAGQVGTEMLYYLVGSRELDGGLMCTASHNPAAYTGAKLVKEGAIALSGDEGIQDIRRMLEEGLPEPSGEPGTVEDADLYEEFQQAALKTIDPSNVKPMKVVVDGGNGKAGPMVGPVLRDLGLDLAETYWTPNGEFPDHEPNPLLEKNRQFIIDKVVAEGADLGIAWDGDADRCFFIDDPGASSTATSSPRSWPSTCWPSSRTATSSTTPAPRGRCRTRSRRPAAARTSTASATPSSRPGCATRARSSAARSPATTTSTTSTTRTPGRCPRSWSSRSSPSRARR